MKYEFLKNVRHGSCQIPHVQIYSNVVFSNFSSIIRIQKLLLLHNYIILKINEHYFGPTH